MYQPLVPSGIDWFVGVALSNDDDDDVDNDNDDDDNDVNVERTPSCKEVTTLFIRRRRKYESCDAFSASPFFDLWDEGLKGKNAEQKKTEKFLKSKNIEKAFCTTKIIALSV